MSLLTRLISFRSTRVEVVHRTGYDTSAEDARQICADYAKFIRVHLSAFPGDPAPEYVKGRPGEVGAEIRYRYEYGGQVTYMTDRVVQWDVDEETGVSTLAWEQARSEPQMPVRNYRCSWTITPEPGHPGRCRLEWTRQFDEPTLLGVVSLAKAMKSRFHKSAYPVMEAYRPYFARMFPNRERGLPAPNDRVLVVGAGPSGLHMAHLLRQRLGIEDITIVEKTGRYGGKTVSEPDRTNRGLGIVHELGTCYLHPAYFAVRELIGELRAMPECDDPAFGREVAPVNYRIRSSGDVDTTLEGWVESNLRKQPKWSPFALARLFVPKADTALELVTAKARYNRLHLKYFGDYNYSLPPQLSPEAMEALDVSFGQFLASNGLTALMPILAYGQTCQGYGSIENTPAFWAMCWITPELLDGYFAIHAKYPKKSMLEKGWGSLWDMIVHVNDFGSRIEFFTEVAGIDRPAGDGPMKVRTVSSSGSERVREFDYLVVAAPGIDPTNQGKSFPHLSPGWKSLVGEENRERFTHAQFRTVLFRREEPTPYLDAHLTLDADRVLGPQVGKGEVFASRDSYLALHPEYSNLRGLRVDPLREKQHEQMAYQYVENGRDLDDETLQGKFRSWADGEIGTGKYQVLKEETWTYFQRADRRGLMDYLPWRVMEMQGRDRTMYVHASSFFESVLDIVNYNNMIVSGLAGELNVLGPLKDDPKPYYDASEHWRMFYNQLVRAALTVVSWTLTIIWTALYVVIRPFLAYTVIRMQRKRFQAAFHTKNLGPWWKFSMGYFLDVSPSVISMLRDVDDPIMKDEPSKSEREACFPSIPKERWALRLNFRDYRDATRIWQKHSKSNYLAFLQPRVWWPMGFRSPSLGDFTRFLAANFPVFYNYLFSWTVTLGFNSLTGFGFRREDERGGGYFIPRCHMLRVARKRYGEAMGDRYCTHVCKIFTEEYLTSVGLPCVLEPNTEKGSCWMRGLPEKTPAFSDHDVRWWMDPPPEAKAAAEREWPSVS